MSELLPKSTNQIVELTADLVAAYVSNNPVPTGDLPGLIAEVYASMNKLGAPIAAAANEPLTPAVPIKKSVTREYIISLEDGKQYRTLKRHLGNLGLTTDEYRKKWSLPADYPMVAPGYSERRSDLAKKLGLGRKVGTKPARRASRKVK